MSYTWSYAATGLTMAIVALSTGQSMVSPVNRPNVLRTGIGQMIFGTVGLVLTMMLFYFGFRLFFDNGFWGLLQLVLVIVAAGFFSRMAFFQNLLALLVLTIACVAQAVKIW